MMSLAPMQLDGVVDYDAGKTLDETVAHFQEAVALYLEGEGLAEPGCSLTQPCW